MPKNSDICRACFSSRPDFYFKCKYCGVLHDLEPTNLHSYCFVSDKVANVYHWLEWVVDRNMPLSEGPPTHAFDVASQAHLPKTLRKYLAATTKAVEKAMAAVIPPDFGAMIDGWTCFGEHYVAVIAIF
ncbi:hypothetical protein PF005_g8199 [Phytophthora fragariae]|uniref:Uncharacterized protein n=1 Tax=Phytophthora fragariae TaxID=53985 RepID=A0A6A3YJW4_9STRA|nr:hypothetical protein PF003_g7023 [Phytophthora fragariae]KAE8941085.1 hypothetical protein PF009_g9118 [Phytophthora fragariae]KAE9016443.1 hypothetical protein PF011_g7149 [Phytophthora fragariae]KAE9105954.1 hypothetical protein PF010_g12800 [Phytophthora fragariae]KAE9106072.1 hypothetical protein PF007_g13538 [Phytophthora fragariae]